MGTIRANYQCVRKDGIRKTEAVYKTSEASACRRVVTTSSYERSELETRVESLRLRQILALAHSEPRALFLIGSLTKFLLNLFSQDKDMAIAINKVAR